jgi:hypothetical protein
LQATWKRVLALLAGGLGLRTILRRRARSRLSESPAGELKARLAATKEPPFAQPDDVEPAHVEAKQAEAEHVAATDVEAKDVEPEAVERPPSQEGVDERRADTHARARHAIEELREKSE